MRSIGALQSRRFALRALGLRWALIGALALGGFGSACKSDGQKVGQAPAHSPQAVVSVDTGGRKVPFRVELAITPEQHARGLMYRQHLDADAGMLFISNDVREQVFWMKNTLIPLDMIFLGADRRIVGIVQNAEPETTSERKVGAPSQYVLEIGGGLSAQLGIRTGQQVEFQGIPSL
jgi:uncharacterized protein